MKATNNSNYRKKVDGTWFEPGETKKVDISEDKFSKYFTLEDETTSTVEEEETVAVNDDDEESSKPDENNNNEGDE